ncbi:small subunit ribosomal protein S21, partial [Rhizobium sp. BK650]|nr:small subunit ribosomal protein S21 [Rhizobium sp. BK650]
PIGANAGQTLTEPKERRQMEVFCPLSSFIGENMHVIVRDNNVEQALRALKKKMQREGLFREMKERRAYEKPSERRVREKAQAIARQRKAIRKKMQREGLLPPARGRVSAR